MAEYTATSGSYTTTLTVTEGAYDIASNTSPVTFTLTLKKNSGTGLWNNDSCPWSININGTSYSGSFTYDFRNYSSLTLKSSTTQTITHDSDGTKKIAVSASVNMDNTPYVYTMSPSGELTLATIPRASDIALSVSSFSITSASGNAFSWSITAKSNSFYNRLRYSIGNKSNVSSNKGQGSSSGYFTNQELLSALPTSTSGSLTVYCDTYSDSGYSNLIGTKSVVITVSVNTSYIKPSVSLGNIGINSSPISGYAVAGHSKVQSAWSTSNSYGATSVTTYFTVSTGSLATTSSSSTSGTVVSNVIPSNASNYTLYIYAYAKDSRGAVSSTVSKSITVYGYQPPTANLSAYRTSSSSSTSEDGAGTYAYVTFSGAVRSSVNSQNSIQSTVCTYSGSISGTATNGGHYALADTQTVTFKLTVTDKVTSSTASVTIATASYPLDLYDNGSGTVGVGLGAIAEGNTLKSGLWHNIFENRIQAPVHTSAGTSGLGNQTGYAVIATIKVLATYKDTPIEFTVTKRNMNRPCRLVVKFTNANSTDPEISQFLADGYLSGVFWLNKSTTSTFQLIAYHSAWEGICITDTQTSTGMWGGISVDYTASFLSTLPSTAINPTALGFAYADNAGNATLAYRLDLPRTGENANTEFIGNKLIVKEYTNTASNLPTSAYFHSLNMMGSDAKYATQLMVGMTTSGLWYRRYENESWKSWVKVATTSTAIDNSNIVTRSSGLTVTHGYVTTLGGTRLCMLTFGLTGNQSNTVGSNAFEGTLKSTYKPLYPIHDLTYYGSTIFACNIGTDGSVQVRTLSAATNITTDTINFTFTYIIA